MTLKKLYLKTQRVVSGLDHAYCAAVIVAAGSASRMKGVDKITAPLCGKTVLARTLSAFETCNMIDEIVVVGREDRLTEIKNICRLYSKVTAIVPGGATRPESVMAGLDAVSKKTELAAIHDGARPLVSDAVICAACRKAAKFGAAAPAIPVKDTVKAAYEGVVDHTPDRSTLFAVQTPQVFDFDLLRGALQKAIGEKSPITDDCSAVEAIGMQVHLTEGSEENIKITTQLDLQIARMLLKRREAECE